jgi:oligosaccharide 4-alpha-D-glucosyltransferase
LSLQKLTNCLAILSLLYLASFNVSASSGQYLSHTIKDKQVFIRTDKADVILSAHGQGAIAVHYQAPQSNLPSKHLPSFAIKEQAVRSKFIIQEQDDKLIVRSKKLSAVINKSPFSISYYQHNAKNKTQLLIKEQPGFFTDSINDEEKKTAIQGFRFEISDNEKLLGGGERVLGMDRRGHRLPLYNKAHYGYTTQANQMNFGIPAVMSSKKYILLFDNSAKGWMDLAKTKENIVEFSAVAGRMAYIIFAAESYPKLLNNYVDVTGKQPLPPRWSLGNFASRFGYRSESEVRDTVNKFIDLDFPLDALILDLYWFGKDIKGHMGNLTWDKESFAEPEKMMADIKAKGVKTVLITEPFVLSTSGKWQDAVENDALAKATDGSAKRFDFYFGNTGLIDVFNEKGRQWFNNIYNQLAQQGVNGWWGDLGEPEVHPSDTLHTLDDGSVVNADAIHNVYGHQWAKMVYENQLSLKPNERPFILMRSGFSGSQRYGMIPWTGDVSRSWGGLKPQVELSLQMSVLGMAYTHSDLGGFAGGETFDQEMYIRWLQYGIFQPIYRPHAQDNIAAEVVFHDKKTQDILRKFIKLRYKLLPYNYSLAYENSTTGMPLMRPLFFEYDLENDANLQTMDNSSSYLWGDAFLVTPVVEAGAKTVSVDLPKGLWFDYFSDKQHTAKKYQGGQTIALSTSLETLPVLVRAGAFIPMIDDIQSTQNYDSKHLTVHYYADESVQQAEYEMYEDDGSNAQAIEQGLFELLRFSAKQNSQLLTIKFKHTGSGYVDMPKMRNITLTIHNVEQQPKEVMLNKKQLNNTTWHSDSNTLDIKFTWQHQPLTLTIQ